MSLAGRILTDWLLAPLDQRARDHTNVLKVTKGGADKDLVLEVTAATWDPQHDMEHGRRLQRTTR
jgi:hypothetical protein